MKTGETATIKGPGSRHIETPHEYYYYSGIEPQQQAALPSRFHGPEKIIVRSSIFLPPRISLPTGLIPIYFPCSSRCFCPWSICYLPVLLSAQQLLPCPCFVTCNRHLMFFSACVFLQPFLSDLLVLHSSEHLPFVLLCSLLLFSFLFSPFLRSGLF